MTKIEEYCRARNIVLSRRQVYCCELLEHHKQRFGIEFSIKSCEDKAIDFWFRGLMQREAFVLHKDINALSEYLKERL